MKGKTGRKGLAGIEISNAVLQCCLKNVMFLHGTACAGKSTMAAMLAERYGLLLCGENYHANTEAIRQITPERYPNLCYFQTMGSWQAFLNRTPEEYARWVEGVSREAAEFEIAELMQLSKSQKVIVDTNLPLDLLKQVAGYSQVAILLSPPHVSVERFFDRPDPDKQFLLSQIQNAEDPEATMQNFRACLQKVNSQENYDMFAHSGFFTLVREDPDADTREETLCALAEHFGLR